MHTTKVVVAKIPIGFDRNINDTIKEAITKWKETSPAGVWFNNHGVNARFDGIDVVNEELGGKIKLVADLDESTAVAYKLMFGSV